MQSKPALPKGHQSRTSPLNKLLKLVDYGLTVVSAPAGYGKTTLAAEALEKLKIPSIWIGLELRHQRPKMLYHEILNALRTLWPNFSQHLTFINQSDLIEDDPKIFLTLFAELEKLPCQFIAVLDNSHYELEPSVWLAVSFFLEKMPANVHVILLCRAKPRLNLGRWRLAGKVLEIGIPDLALTETESGRLLEAISGQQLQAKSVATLHRLSEGWIVGLQLIALRLKEMPDSETCLEKIDWKHPYLFEYMLEEILNNLPNSDRNFLLKISILQKFNPELCNAITGIQDSHKKISDLLERNLFVIQDEDKGQSRFHRLISEGLQGLLSQRFMEQIPLLHIRAANWYLANEQIESALDHAILAADPNTLESVSRKALELFLRNSDFKALDHQTLRIPEVFSEAKPSLAIFLAWGFFHLGREAEGKIHLDRAQCLLKQSSDSNEGERDQRHLLAHVFYLRGIIYRLKGDIQIALRLAYRACSLVPGDGQFLKASLKIQIGMGSFLINRIPEAIAAFKDAMELAESKEHYLAFFGAGYTLSEIYRLQGSVERQAELHRALYSYTQHSGSHSGPASGYACISRARIFLDQGKIAEARVAAEQGIILGNKGGNIRILNYGHAAMAMVLSAEGDIEKALAHIDAAEIVARKNRLHWGIDLDDLTAMKLRLQFEAGIKITAEIWIEKIYPRILNPCLNEWDRARTAVRLLTASEKTEKALRLLISWEKFSVRMDFPLMRAELMLLRSISEWNQNNHCLSMDTLARTFTELEKFHSIGLIRGLETYLKPIVSRLKESQRFPATLGIFANTASIQNLSDREIEVLKAMRDGKSNKEIAFMLFVAPNTVKTHLKNIYSKLQVNNRTHAVMLAETSGMIQ